MGDWFVRMAGRLLDGIGPLLACGCLLAALPKAGDTVLILFLGLVSWPVVASVVRAETLRLSHAPYVEAAITVGVGNWCLTRDYYLPAMAERLLPLLAALFASFAGVIGALAFLGLGANTQESLGFLIFDSQNYIRSNPLYFVAAFGIFVLLLAVAAAVMLLAGQSSGGEAGLMKENPPAEQGND